MNVSIQNSNHSLLTAATRHGMSLCGRRGGDLDLLLLDHGVLRPLEVVEDLAVGGLPCQQLPPRRGSRYRRGRLVIGGGRGRGRRLVRGRRLGLAGRGRRGQELQRPRRLCRRRRGGGGDGGRGGGVYHDELDGK